MMCLPVVNFTGTFPCTDDVLVPFFGVSGSAAQAACQPSSAKNTWRGTSPLGFMLKLLVAVILIVGCVLWVRNKGVVAIVCESGTPWSDRVMGTSSPPVTSLVGNHNVV